MRGPEEEQKSKRKEIEERRKAIQKVESKYIDKAISKILTSESSNSSGVYNVPLHLQRCESFRKYSSRITNTVYQAVYNMLMEACFTGSSYSFSRRTAGTALDENHTVFMKDVDVDYITRQAVSRAFKEQMVEEDERKQSKS